LFDIVMLGVYLHRDAVAQIVRLELGVSDQPAVGLTEAPEVLAAHRHADPALARATPARPEERRIGGERGVLLRDDILDVLLEVLDDHGGEGDVTGLPALHDDATEPPTGSQGADAEGGDRVAAPPRGTENE